MSAHSAFVTAAGGFFGLIFGSFATAAAHRLKPRAEGDTGDAVPQSLAKDRSRCPHCGHVIAAYDNIPVISYLILRGRCRNCGQKISIRYPVMELATGALFAAAAWRYGATVHAAVYAGLFWTLVVLTAIDVDTHKLPSRIIYPAFIAGAIGLVIVAAIDGSFHRLVGAGLGALMFGGFLFIVAFIYPAGMGLGDVRLAFLLGLFLGYQGGPGLTGAGMFLSFLLGGVGGIVTVIAQKGGRKTALAFGPYLALGTVVAIFVGQRLLDGYLNLIS
ncbi:MAG: leader peptidase (prepilin peptidase) / N-methyltransferase [Actinomycetota bacterium]|nr:leader peptidase (prepilin peptidase) / N-methyltransferase [Actinomycetota bacterium]